MEVIENKYAELDKYLKEEISSDELVKELTDLREQCLQVFMNVLIYEPEIYAEVDRHTMNYMYSLRRLIEIFSKIETN